MMKISAPRPILLASVAALGLSACAQPGAYSDDPNANAKRGALIGAGLGAAAGILASDDKDERKKNAVKGALIGGAGGAIYGNVLDRQEADLRRQIGNDDVIIRNTGDRLIVTMPQDILFATDSTTVRADLQSDLRALAGNLQAYPNSTVQVIGHTDQTGDAAYNQDLSERRARAVAGVLVSSGVSSGRIQTIGRGESQPIASNLTAEGRAQNRRVEIVILPNAA